MKIRGRGLWERIDEYAMAILVTVAMLGAAHFGAGPLAPAHPEQAPGLFEGSGAVTVGCALWDVPTDGSAYDGDPKDFYLSADRDEFVLAFVHQGKIKVASGQQCGISVDHRVFPTEERKHDRSASASGSNSNR